ncbi:MAG: hypothetical protein II896_01310 [Clostridia bacterium]|nr:hypothetical protein [Clostridia bacterium]
MNKTCVVVTNTKSGRWREEDREKIAAKLREYDCRFEDVDAPLPPLDGVDALAVAGGDGTLHNFLNRVKGAAVPLYYFPTGTLNEKARIGDVEPLVGQINDDYFVYVVAAGSFTPIGYTAAIKDKKRYKWWAYLWQAVREYKVHRIEASVSVDGAKYEGTYTLIMVLRSPRCFLFRFNKLYAPDKNAVHVLLIKAPPRDDLWGRVRIFAPLFRAFFVGFRKEKDGKRLVFREGSSAVVRFSAETVCNVDGEKQALAGTYRLRAAAPTPKLTVCNLKREGRSARAR